MANNVTDLGKVGMTLKGEWNSSTSYERLDTVTYEGSLYIAIRDNSGSQPSESNTNWMLGAKHGEFTEQQLEDFKAEVVAESKEEMDDYTDDKKTELDTYTGAKKAELDTYEGTKEAELNTYASGLKDDFDSNATSKTNTFNTNATSKTNDFDSNAVAKTTAFDTNASTKTSAFDDNATAKTTAFDENAEEKTGDFNDNVDEKTAEFDAHVEEKEAEFDENVDEIQQQITDIQEFIDSELEQGITEKGTRADVSDSAKWYGELAPEGRTEQKQMIGSNKLDEETIKNATYSEGTYNYTLTNIQGGTLYFKASLKEGKTPINGVYVAISSNGANPNNGTSIFSIKNGTITNETTDFTNVSNIYFAVYPKTISIEELFEAYNFWVSETDTTYEPYCGGTASPNPDYPQAIQNVEGRSCTNMFDIQAFENQLITHKILNDSGVEVVDSGSSYSKYKILLKANQTYYLKGAWQRIYYYDLEGNFKSRSTNHNGFSMAYTPTEDEYIGLQIGDTYWNNNHGTEQINEGSTAMPYEPYFEGKRLEFNVCNKNLINPNNILNYEIVPNKHEAQIYNGRNAYLISAKANTTYTFSRASVGTASYSYLAIFDEFIIGKNNSYTNEKNISNGLVDTVTTTENTKYIMFFSGTGISENVQIEEGTTATPYEEHKEQLIPFPLQEGQKLMKGDYLADDGVHHVRGQVVLDGSENWAETTTKYTGLFSAALTLINMKKKYIYRGDMACNYFKEQNFETREEGMTKSSNPLNYSFVILRISENKVTNLNQFKSWLAEQYANGTPVIIEYELAEETIDPYTEAQQKAYNKLKKLMLNQGINHIWTETDGLEPNLQLTYYKSNKQRLNNIEARLELLEN